jgi:hypothetical protein
MLTGMSQERRHWQSDTVTLVASATFMSLTRADLFLFVTWYSAGRGRDTDTIRPGAQSAKRKRALSTSSTNAAA